MSCPLQDIYLQDALVGRRKKVLQLRNLLEKSMRTGSKNKEEEQQPEKAGHKEIIDFPCLQKFCSKFPQNLGEKSE